MADSAAVAGHTMSDGRVVRLAASLGLGMGLAEGLFRIVQRVLLGHRTFLSRDVVWMAPLADLALLLLVALVLLLVSRIWRRALERPVVIGALAFVALLGPISAYPRLHWWAGLALAAGGAAVAARAVGRWPAVERLGLRLLPVLGLLAGLALVGARGAHILAERRALSAIREITPGDGDPDVLLVILDTVRASSMGLYGYPLPTTPGLERLEGAIVFDAAWAPAPWTLTSHAGFFTGLHPFETEADWLSPLEEGPLTLAEYLGRRGYVTGGFVGNLIYATYETGLDRGFAHYEDYPVSLAMIANSAWLPRRVTTTVARWLGRDRFLVDKTAERINRDVLDWVDRSGERPFFAFVNYMDAHAPTVPPDSLYDRFGPRRTWRPKGDLLWRDDWTPEDLAAERAAYDATIAYLDAQVTDLLARLDARGRLANTLVIVASDHGEQFGEHGLIDHGNSLYRPLLHVPLLLRLPGATGGARRVGSPVTLRDLPATVADLLGDGGTPFPGRSLRPSWADGGEAYGTRPLLSEVSRGIRMEEWQPAAIGDMRSLVLDGHHYILNGDGREELYSLDDPAESIDLASDPAATAILESARATLDSLARR